MALSPDRPLVDANGDWWLEGLTAEEVASLDAYVIRSSLRDPVEAERRAKIAEAARGMCGTRWTLAS